MLNSFSEIAILLGVSIFSTLTFLRVMRRIPDTSTETIPQDFHLPEISFEGETPDDILDSFQTSGLSTFACSKAGGSMNVDFCQVIQSRPGFVSFYVGDVSGKGLSASLFQTVCTSILKLASAVSLDPVGIVSELNRTLCGRGIDGRYATLLYGTLDLSSGRLRLLSAGHPSPIRVTRNDKVDFLDCKACLPVGILEEHRYALSEHRLMPGDTLLLYSDGVIEARDAGRQFFGSRKLATIAQKFHSTLPHHMVERIFEQVQHFSSSRKDDQTILALHYSGLPSEYATNTLAEAV